MVKTLYTLIIHLLLLILFNIVGYCQTSVNDLTNSSSISYTNFSDNSINKNKLRFKSSHYYISLSGSGNIGSEEKPAKSINAITDILKPGDIIHVAAGTYTQTNTLNQNIITVPVSIYGGYSLDFKARDPWGKYKTIFTSNDEINSLSSQCININAPRLEGKVVLDGLIIKNKSNTSKKLKSSSLNIELGRNSEVAVMNCLIMNEAANQSAINIQINKNSVAIIEDNVIINYAGKGISLKPICFNSAEKPKFIIKNNTIFSDSNNMITSNHLNSEVIMDKNTKVLTSDNSLDISNKIDSKIKSFNTDIEIELDDTLGKPFPVNSTGSFQ